MMDMEISALRQNILFSTTPGHMGLTFQIGTKFQLAHVCFVIFINSKYSVTTVYKSKQPLVDLRMAFKDIEVSNGHFLGAMGWDGFFSARTIGINGFSMILLPFDHHH